ncbi:MAG: alpha/beta hydrolase [Bdellovibrionaceae bacterium]|nr:alpha/beta hydrolase [Pseudobdellovibrionaceae bacterium]
MRGTTNVGSLFFNFTQHKDKADFINQRAPISGLGEQNIFNYEQKICGMHIWVEKGHGTPLIFCPGLFGSFQNFAEIGHHLSHQYKIIVPYLPMYDLPLSDCSIVSLADYLETFIDDLGLKNCVLAGNSMGGGTVLNYALKRPEKVSKLILFSSSGLSLIPMRDGFFSVKNYEWVRMLLKEIYFDPDTLHECDIQEVYETIQNKQILLRCMRFVKSTKKNLLHSELPKLQQPTLIIWGKEDKVTPVKLAYEFKSLIKNSSLALIDDCGHVAPHEQPKACLEAIRPFLEINPYHLTEYSIAANPPLNLLELEK